MLPPKLIEYSSFFSKLAQVPDLFEQVKAQATAALTPTLIEALWQQQSVSRTDPAACAKALARLRKVIIGTLMVRDFSSQASLAEVELAMTALAELAVRVLLESLEHQAFERFGIPKN